MWHSLFVSFAVLVVFFLSGEKHREQASSSPTIVFVSRNALPNGSSGDLPGSGPLFRTAVVGGKLMLRERNGKLQTLVDSAKLIDVADPCVSWDGKRVLFSGIQHPDSNWRIFEVHISGEGFKQLTFSDRSLDLSQFGSSEKLFVRYDDFDPCYLPNGKIVFASTRYPSLSMLADVRASNLYVMNADGSNMHRITSERNGGEEPAIDPVTGRIVYARWWGNIDRPSNTTRDNLSREDASSLTGDIGNVWHAVSINPDGNALRLYAGYLRTRHGSHTYKPALLSDGRLLSTFSPNTSLVPHSGGTGVRWFKPGADYEHHIIGTSVNEMLQEKSPLILPFAADPVPLSENMILISYSPDGREYGIYSCDLNGNRLKKIVDLPGTLELEPQIVVAGPIPPVVPEQFISPVSDLPPTEDPETHARNDFFRFDCMNIFTNGKVDEPMPDAPRIGRNLTIQFFMNPQRQSGDRPDPSILLKAAPVSYVGGVHEHDIPADVPVFEQIIDERGRVHQTTDGRFAHVAGFNFERLGAGTKCVGCHIGHSMLEVPKNGAMAQWFNAAPSAEVMTSSTLKGQDARFYAAGNIVDRQARVGGDSVVWVANEADAWIELRWPVPIEAKEFVLYNIPHNRSVGTTVTVQNIRIFLYYEGREVGSIRSTRSLSSDGTAILFSPTKIDSARIVIEKFRGTFKHKSLAGLAEIEATARLFEISTQH